MSEFQSHAAFHRYQLENPHCYYCCPIILPPSLMYGEDTRTFWIAVNGTSSTALFEISIHVDVNVESLSMA